MSTVVEEYATLPDAPRVAPSPPIKLTLQQANKLADGQPFELIDGKMVFKEADYQHSKTQSLLCFELGNHFEAAPIGQVFIGLTHLLWPENPYEVREPDVSVILNEHLELEKRYPTRAPDIAIEIISEDDAWTKLFAKARLYFEKGSREVWLVDPYEKGIMVVTPTGKHWVLDTLTSELLPGFQVELNNIFTWPAAK